MGIIVLSEEEIDRTDYRGYAEEQLVAGQRFKVETSPDGIELLNVQVPVAKKWTVQVWVKIVETDA